MLNTVIEMGRLTADPELRHTPNDIAVTSFTIAQDRFVKANDKVTDFFDCVAWRNTAEFICKYFSKGSMIAVNGTLQTRTYTDKNGNNRKAVEIVVDNAHFCESRRENPTTEECEATRLKKAEQGFEEVADEEELPF